MRVERAQRLVEEQHSRPPGECTRERDALPLTAGEGGRPCGSEVRDPEALQQTSDRAAERDVVPHGHVREQRVLLEDHPDGAVLRRQRGPLALVEPHAALRLDEPGDRAQQRRLAGPRRADDADRLGADLERYAKGESAERDGDVQPKRSHLTARRSVNENTTSSAPIASATSNERANSA